MEALIRPSRRRVAVISVCFNKCRVGLAEFIKRQVFNDNSYLS